MLDASSIADAEPHATPERLTDVPPHLRVDGRLTLTHDGHWLWDGDPITHPRLCAYLLRQLRCTAEGRYQVANGPQRALVDVRDAPYLVTRVEPAPAREGARVHLNDGTTEPLDPATLCAAPDHVLYVEVKRGRAGAAPGMAHRARFTREAVFQLEPWLVTLHDGSPALTFSGTVFPVRVAEVVP